MRYKAYKYRIYPNSEQQELINKHIGCCRFIYNLCLEKKINAYKTSNKSISCFDLIKLLPSLKKEKETSFLKEVNSLSLQAAIRNLDNAYKKFFKEKKGFPRFKSKRNARQSFQVVQNTTVDFDEKKVYIPKFKEGIKCRYHRFFNGKIKNSTISRTSTGKYYISILVELDEDNPEKKPIDENKAVGIDLGIKTFATLSNGEEIHNPKNLRNALTRLKRLQRRLSRKAKGSNNRENARRAFACQYERVTNRRNDFLEKVTHQLVTTYDTICLETLSARNMMKNNHLAQALSDIAIGRFNELIEQKADWYGVNILRIGRFEPSSKMCSCGYVYKDLKLSQRVWTCPNCGRRNQRDLLAANNIKAFAFNKRNNTAGTAEIHACGDMNPVRDSAQEAHKSLVCG
jgi:putative transposase